MNVPQMAILLQPVAIDQSRKKDGKFSKVSSSAEQIPSPSTKNGRKDYHEQDVNKQTFNCCKKHFKYPIEICETSWYGF